MNITGKELRQKYLDFFKNYPGFEHHVLESAPLVPSDEEQLEGKEKVLFTSAGMQPLIPYLTGKKDPPFKRLVDCQKCVRTDDIEEVGDNTHHTFFEMLGNWSIGDYGKKEAIEMSYKFLVEELGIDKEKIAVTVFEGDSDAPRDEDAADAWKTMGITKISYLGKEDNWWPTSRREPDGTMKNAFGPCGPDTEIFYWTGEGKPEGSPESDERWVEIWNNVFMQYSRKEDGTLEDLPTKNVDTGMGLERTLSILTGKKNAYETDLFGPIKNRLQEISSVNFDEDRDLNRYFRIIADHIKASVMLISAGAAPSNKLQGYITRRLLRRAIWYGDNYLKIDMPFMHKLVESVIEIYGDVYPELNEYREHVKVIIQEEEVKFRKMLISGKKEIPRLLNQYSKDKGVATELTTTELGEFTYKVYETYGFPPEIVKDYLESQGLNLGENKDYQDAFESAKITHQNSSRSASAGAFKGGLAGHSEVEIKYHTITHLLHQALRDVLGESVYQKGSNITAERLRFDFSFDRKMTAEEVKKTEEIINARIIEDLVVDQKTLPIEKAREMNAIGIFNDKYAKEVSVYAIGPNFEYDSKAKDTRERGGYYSMEFCGGPHVERTSKIGKIVIQKEEAVAAGIRRIRAVVES